MTCTFLHLVNPGLNSSTSDYSSLVMGVVTIKSFPAAVQVSQLVFQTAWPQDSEDVLQEMFDA